MIELSIVLVIVGLLIGGVLAGQDLIHAAAVRAMVSEKEKLSTAFFAFKGQYDYLPGDLPNSDAMLGTAGSNGNGNGYIDDECSVGVTATGIYQGWPYNAEYWSMWQQLAKAGVLWGPTFDTNNRTYPHSKYGSGVGYVFYNNIQRCDFIDSTWGPPITDIILVTGGLTAGFGYVNPSLTPADAYSIDKKIDDGLPGSGNVEVWGPGANGYWFASEVSSSGAYSCATTNVSSTAVYDLTVKTHSCLMLWLNMIP
jgi:hypothetical protein